MAPEKPGHTTFPIGPLSYTRTVQALKEALGQELEFAVAEMDEKRCFTDGFEYLSNSDAAYRASEFKKRYLGRMGAYFRSQQALKPEQWSIPAFKVGGNPLESTPWNNSVVMDNTLDGSTPDELYFAYGETHSEAVLRFDGVFPNPASAPLGSFFGFGFEPVRSLWTGICVFRILPNDSRIIWLYPTEAGVVLRQSAPITLSWGQWRQYLLYFRPPVVRLFEGLNGVFTLVGSLDAPDSPRMPWHACFFNENRLAITRGCEVGQLFINGLEQVDDDHPLPVEDTGLNTNPALWLHLHHWQANQVTITVAGAGGEQNLGPAVPAGEHRRIRTLNISHEGTNNTTVALRVAAGAQVDSFMIPAQSDRLVSAEDGWDFTAGQTPAVRSSDVTGGNTLVTPLGVEAA